MTRHDPAWLGQITGTSEKWRRRCSGQPAEGIVVGSAGLRAALTCSTSVAVGAGGVIAWRAGGNSFTAEPVKEEPDE